MPFLQLNPQGIHEQSQRQNLLWCRAHCQNPDTAESVSQQQYLFPYTWTLNAVFPPFLRYHYSVERTALYWIDCYHLSIPIQLILDPIPLYPLLIAVSVLIIRHRLIANIVMDVSKHFR